VTRNLGDLFNNGTSLGNGGVVVSLLSGGVGSSDEALGTMALQSSRWRWQHPAWAGGRVLSTRGWRCIPHGGDGGVACVRCRWSTWQSMASNVDTLRTDFLPEGVVEVI
jgi:hypothetical protein